MTDEPFRFEISSSEAINQANYEALGTIINDYIYFLLESNGLTRHYIPSNLPKEEASFVYFTLQEIQKVEKLMIIIHGSGAVRAGQWSRSLIINDSLDTGSVLPYIKRARQEGYEVLVMNTNDNERDGNRIEGLSDPKHHAETTVRELVQPTEPNHIVIVAHSYGGIVTTYLARRFENDFNEKVKAVVFTDSNHCKRNITERLVEVGVNFIASSQPINTLISNKEHEMIERSAGTTNHELTSHSCIDYAFEFIKERE